MTTCGLTQQQLKDFNIPNDRGICKGLLPDGVTVCNTHITIHSQGLGTAGVTAEYLSPPVNSVKRYTSKQDTFKKKLMRIRRFEEKCDVCNEVYRNGLEAARIVDHNMKESLEKAFLENDNLPASINHEQNGLMLCPTCHNYFDKKEPEIRITPDGTIMVYGNCLASPRYNALNGTKVYWTNKIGNKNYPSSELLTFALKLKPGDKKRVRELIEFSEDSDDEEELTQNVTLNNTTSKPKKSKIEKKRNTKDVSVRKRSRK